MQSSSDNHFRQRPTPLSISASIEPRRYPIQIEFGERDTKLGLTTLTLYQNQCAFMRVNVGRLGR